MLPSLRSSRIQSSRCASVCVNCSADTQLARRKAEELEDFSGRLCRPPWPHQLTTDGTDAAQLPTFTQEETDAGSALMKQFMEVWKERVEARGPDVTEEEQVDELVKLAKEFGQQFEASPWIKALMERL